MDTVDINQDACKITMNPDNFDVMNCVHCSFYMLCTNIKEIKQEMKKHDWSIYKYVTKVR